MIVIYKKEEESKCTDKYIECIFFKSENKVCLLSRYLSGTLNVRGKHDKMISTNIL